MRRVVVTGIGVIAPSGVGKGDFWKNIINGKTFTTAYTDFPNVKLKSRVKSSIENFNMDDFQFTEEEILKNGRPTLLALAAAEMAICDSRLCFDKIMRERTGVCMGNAIADTPFSEKQFMKLESNLAPPNSTDKYCPDISKYIDKNLYFKGMYNCISSKIAQKFDLHGITFTMSTGCTSGIDAVGFGNDMIKDEDGDTDIMICGGSEAPLSLITFKSFDEINCITHKNLHPETASSPFDATRDGFVLSEGSGVLVLEEYEHAIARGAHIYCEILDFESCSNAKHMTDLSPDGQSLAELIEKSLEVTDLVPEKIDYISAHGSSTRQNDVFETSAYKLALGKHAYKIPISSIKSMQGHALGAASAIELISCCLVFEHGKIPPTANLMHPDKRCDLDYVPGHFRDKNVNVILKTASGFSGIHSVMLMGRV